MLESAERIDLLLSDVVMPNGVSGLDLAQDARRLRQDLKIVLVSGYLRDRDALMTAAPDLLFLVKPFSQAQLAETIAAALDDSSRGGVGRRPYSIGVCHRSRDIDQASAPAAAR